jgi:redox-sensitive bicupin YhaK (pirin superfamily)
MEPVVSATATALHERMTGRGNPVREKAPEFEPIVGHGPFVMNSRTEIEEAFKDYQLGRMGDLD